MKKLVFIAVCLCCVAAKAQNNVSQLENQLTTQKLSEKEQIEIYKQLCEYYEHNDIAKLTDCAQKGLLIAEKKNSNAMADFQRFMGVSYDLQGKTDTAVAILQKTLDLSIKTKNKTCEAMTYLNLAYIFTKKRQYKNNELALDYRLKALQIVEESGNQKNIALALTRLGNYHIFLANFDLGISYLQKALKIAEEIDYKYVLSDIYCTFSDMPNPNNNDDTSVKWAEKGLKIAQAANDKQGEIANLQMLGYIYCLGKHDYATAEKYADKCWKTAEEYGSPNYKIAAWTVLSFVYLYQRRYEECKIVLLKAWETDSFNIQLSTLTNLAAAYLYSGDIDTAHEFFKNYVYTMEENANIQFQNYVAEQQVKYETEKKELQIAAMEKQRTLYFGIGAVVIIVFLLAFALIYYRHRLNIQKRKNMEQKLENAQQEQQIVAAQATLDGESAERLRLARDLHDGLGGMLSAVRLNLDNLEHLDNARSLLNKSIEELRRLAHNIMPASLQYGLRAALDEFCSAIPVAHFHFYGDEMPTDEKVKLLFYRCAHELVNNAVKYSAAENINVQIVQKPDHIALTVADDGRGFDPSVQTGGMGLRNLRDRVAAFGGTIEISSAPNDGTEARIELKIEN